MEELFTIAYNITASLDALLSEKGEKDIDIKFVHIPLKLACEIGLGCSSHGAPFRLPFRSKFKFKY